MEASPPPRDFPSPTLEITDYCNLPPILFHSDEITELMHQETTRHLDGDAAEYLAALLSPGGGDEDWMSTTPNEADDEYDEYLMAMRESFDAADDQDSMSTAEDYDAADDGEYSFSILERDEVSARLSKTAAEGGGDREVCAICLDDLYREDRAVGGLGCRHGFHGDCIGEWLRMKNVCPLCRAIV